MFLIVVDFALELLRIRPMHITVLAGLMPGFTGSGCGTGR